MNHSKFIIPNSSFAAGVGIPSESKMTELSQTLYAQMAESEDLDKIICKNLTKLGFPAQNQLS